MEVIGIDTVDWCANVEVTVFCEGAVAGVQMLLYDDMKHWEHSESLVGWMVEKTGYVFMSYELNAGQNHKLKVTDKFFDNVAKFKYLGMTLPNQNCLHEEIMSVLYSRSVSHGLVQNLLFSHLRSTTVKCQNVQTCNLACCFYRCKTWCVTLWEEHGLRVFENRVLKKMLGLRRSQ
jgi:hypothetical protein